MSTSRRNFLKVMGGGAVGAMASSPLLRAFAEVPAAARDEFFIFIHANGAWDVTVSLDPRNAAQGLVDPATEDAIDVSGLRNWRRVGGSTRAFELVRPSGCNINFGPAIGKLAEDRRFERVLVINGIAMNTVSHPDGTAFSSTGRHLSGGKASAPSIDTVLASEFANVALTGRGAAPLLPSVSLRFPSFFNGPNLDSRALPLRIDNVGTVGKSFSRPDRFTADEDRDDATNVVRQETSELAARSYYPELFNAYGAQLGSLQEMLRNPSVLELFSAAALRRNYCDIIEPDNTNPACTPSTGAAYTFESGMALNAAFAIEAFKLGLARCVSFGTTSLDTHFSNYEDHPQHQQELFDVVGLMMDSLGRTAHPTLAGHKLIDHTHIVIVSEFCRTPQINIAGGRDHYPNNSCVIISPKFTGNRVFGTTDTAQLLPSFMRRFADGMRAITPADVLATVLHAFEIDPRRFMRDGDPMTELLRRT